MNAETTTGTDSTTQTITAEPTAQPELSITEHAKEFDGAANKEPNEKPQSATQKRDESGQFQKGRHRAESQKARAEDVPRIAALTGRAKTAEERAAASDARVASLEAELATLKRNHAPAQQIARAEARVEQAQPVTVTPPADDPEPQETDPKYGGDYGKYLRDAAKWDGRQSYRDEQAKATAAKTRSEREASDRAILKTFSERVDAARKKYSDFDAVALGETPIRDGSAMDAWITEHKGGADVLYYLHQPAHRAELESLLTKPVIDQLDDLTLLAQRLLSPTSASAGTTGAATGRPIQVVLPHRPPTPVRTEAQRTSDEPAPTDGSLSVRQHAKQFSRR